jgi:hypothetical protein
MTVSPLARSNNGEAMLGDLWELGLDPGGERWTLRGGGQASSADSATAPAAVVDGLAPSARCAHAAAAANGGAAFVYGGLGVVAQADGSATIEPLHDLWRFEQAGAVPGGAPWTRVVAGAGGAPGHRATHALWADAGFLWLHGGDAQGYRADLWSYEIKTNIWREVQGAAANAPGVYSGAAPPQAGVGVRPGARHRQTVWPDARTAGVFWVSGGEGVDGSGQQGWLDDVWKLSLPADGAGEAAWEWVAGSAVAAGYAPPLGWGPSGRASVAVLNGGVDRGGRVAMFGGYRMVGRASEVLNDLWLLRTDA